MAPRAPWTYKRSGVDLEGRSVALKALLAATDYRPPADHGRPVRLPGHYAGLVRLGRETLALTTDTVGTKTRLAERLGRWEEVGEDIVGVNVNDLAAVGARPTALVDTVLCDRPRKEPFRAIGRGLGRGLREARCALLGGETAIVPDIVEGIDLGATALGFFPGRRRPITGAEIRAGDALIGIPSRGIHANGFTLVRRLIAARQVDLRQPRPGGRRAAGVELLTPTRIYSHVIDSIADQRGLTGLAHVSGGGVRNLLRLRPNVGFLLDEWPEVPSLFRWVQQLGALTELEMFQTFNMGIGFLVACRAAVAGRVLESLAGAGARDARPVGRVTKGHTVKVPSAGIQYSEYL